eukprot:Awhi_evm1s5792
MLFKSVATILLLAFSANAAEQIFEESSVVFQQGAVDKEGQGQIYGESTVLCPVGVKCWEPVQAAQSGCDYVNCNTVDANGNNVARTVFCCQKNMNNCCPLVAAQTIKFKLGN